MDPADDANDDKESYVDEDGLFVPGGYVRNVVLDNIIAAHSPGPPNAIGLDQTTDTTSDDREGMVPSAVAKSAYSLW